MYNLNTLGAHSMEFILSLVYQQYQLLNNFSKLVTFHRRGPRGDGSNFSKLSQFKDCRVLLVELVERDTNS